MGIDIPDQGFRRPESGLGRRGETTQQQQKRPEQTPHHLRFIWLRRYLSLAETVADPTG
jgi:hypothetical protein